MTQPAVPTADGRDLLRRLAAPQPPPFAILHRPRSTGAGRLEVLLGEVTELTRLADLPLPDHATPGPELLALVPYRQITERGYACRDGGEPVLALAVTTHAEVTVADALELLPVRPLRLSGTGFTPDDDAYAELVRTVVRDEIGQGAGANFVLQRAFTATVDGWSPATALTLFRNLLSGEHGAYWTFVVHTGSRTLVGATPERHVSLEDGTAVMNPISGTLRYPPTGTTVSGVLDFLADAKETDELYMVVDEELKMMASVCDGGGRVVGPYLKEMARLAHTEYLIEGQTTLDVRTLLRDTMFAPTVTGSPLENACRVIARHEPTGRGYYSGVAALIGRDDAGRRTLDSAILIRTADVDSGGSLRLRVGATLVRHSDPGSEVLETHAKAAGLLAAAGAGPVAAPTSRRGRRRTTLGGVPAVRAALARRNDGLARFWLEPARGRYRLDPRIAGRRILVVDAEDTFTTMLGHQLASLGLDVTRVLHHDVDPATAADGRDLVLVGPGPGDPLDLEDPRIRTLRAITERLLDTRTPFVSICLGHQVLSSLLGLPLARKPVPSQGLQREVDLFGRRERVGFYNTFTAVAPGPLLVSPRTGTAVAVSRDEPGGEVHALRGEHFSSIQFHAESVLTTNGPEILADLVAWSLGHRAVGTAATEAV
ncbi:MAG TPA: anthranilate synthase family protein [Mycobacteriales bacterium]|jgi:phenazine biosynthesis protein phzE|nr:anthranilate synthase family protein [Mycobacteriales bacterium]